MDVSVIEAESKLELASSSPRHYISIESKISLNLTGCICTSHALPGPIRTMEAATIEVKVSPPFRLPQGCCEKKSVLNLNERPKD